MKAKLLFSKHETSSAIQERLTDGRYYNFRFAVAYARKSGVNIIQDSMVNFRSRENTLVQGIVGINQGNTSQQALSALERILDGNLYLRFNISGRAIFHPKIYIMGDKNTEKFSSGSIIVGSSNLTGGGLNTNEECNVLLDIEESNSDFSDAVENFWSKIRENSDEFSTIQSNQKLLMQLMQHNLLVDEDTPHAKERGDSPVTQMKKIKEILSSVFTHEYRYFATILSGFDVSPDSSDPVILIPLIARDKDPNFWFWPDFFLQERKHRDLYLTVDVTIDGKKEREEIRMYSYLNKSEFRLKSKMIKRQGAAGDILLVARDDQTMKISLIRKNDPQYDIIFRNLDSKARSGKKRFGYFHDLPS